jgi:hypothetical protein
MSHSGVLLMRDVCAKSFLIGGWNLKPDSVWVGVFPCPRSILCNRLTGGFVAEKGRTAMTMLQYTLHRFAAIPLIIHLSARL